MSTTATTAAATINLEELKKIVESHMRKELDIMEMVLTMDDEKDVQAFNEWYTNHPYCKGIREIQELVRAGRGSNNKP